VIFIIVGVAIGLPVGVYAHLLHWRLRAKRERRAFEARTKEMVERWHVMVAAIVGGQATPGCDCPGCKARRAAQEKRN
jgi:hypothetical protein